MALCYFPPSSVWAAEIKAKEIHPPGGGGMLGLGREREEEKMKGHSRS